MTFARMKKKATCYCCGKNHKVNDCPLKDNIPKDQWWIRLQDEKVYNHMVGCMTNQELHEAGLFVSRGNASASNSWHFYAQKPGLDLTD